LLAPLPATIWSDPAPVAVRTANHPGRVGVAEVNWLNVVEPVIGKVSKVCVYVVLPVTEICAGATVEATSRPDAANTNRRRFEWNGTVMALSVETHERRRGTTVR
jgi:hypothetical protein